jgi:multisubunit Na+/H+ antiporter MnhF subunit
MTDQIPGMNPAATDPLPYFMPAPGATDVLYVVTAIFLVLLIFSVGILYLKLHSLPEHLAHGVNKIQFQIVGALALLALFTHNHIFWIAALLLALIQFPDFSTPLNSISRSLEKLSGTEPPPDEVAMEALPELAHAPGPAPEHEPRA